MIIQMITITSSIYTLISRGMHRDEWSLTARIQGVGTKLMLDLLDIDPKRDIKQDEIIDAPTEETIWTIKVSKGTKCAQARRS